MSYSTLGNGDGDDFNQPLQAIIAEDFVGQQQDISKFRSK